MTLCIAAICRKDEKSYIVTASDYLHSDEGSSIESRLPKYAYASPWEPHTWGMLYAGDPTAAQMILSWAIEILKNTSAEDRCGVGDVMAAYEEAFQKMLAKTAEQQILGRFLMSMGDFRRNGQASLGDQTFEALVNDIRRISLETDILIAGFSTNKSPYIFKISDSYDSPPRTELHVASGFSAIGAGCVAAEQSLVSVFDTMAPLDEVIYRVAEAKFKGETARSVGSSTLITVHEDDGNWHHIPREDALKFKGQWEEYYRRIPKEISSAMSASLKTIPWAKGISSQAEREKEVKSKPNEPETPFQK